jgi:hypothetical protein
MRAHNGVHEYLFASDVMTSSEPQAAHISGNAATIGANTTPPRT